MALSSQPATLQKRRYNLSGAIDALRTALQMGPLTRAGRCWLYAPKRRASAKRQRKFSPETADQLIRLGEAERIGNLLFRKAVPVFVAFTVWSICVMSSQSANAYQFTPTTWEVLNLPADKLRAIETEGRKPKHIARSIDIRTIPTASQAALISISNHELCQVMTTRLRSSTVRFNVHDFAILRDMRMVERAPGDRWHVLTDDGKAYAHLVAQQIANEMGLHVTWTGAGASRYFRTVHCTCGWSTRLYSERFDANADHRHRIARHLAEAAGATRSRSG